MQRFLHLFPLLMLLSVGQIVHAQRHELGESALNRDIVTSGLMNTLEHLRTQMQNPEFANYHRSPNDFERLKSEVRLSLSNVSFIREVRLDYSPQFLKTLSYDHEAFQVYSDSLKGKTVTQTVFDGVINASTDIAIKAGLIRRSRTDRVKTTVNTVDEKGPVQDCYVWYTPFLKDDAQHKQKFDKRSTPTTDYISGGKWYIWSEKAGKTGAKQEYLCDGPASRTIDIPAP